MKKKIIGIDINEVLRARWIQFDRYYVEEFGEEGVPDEEKAYVYDFWNEYKWKGTEDTVKYLVDDAPEEVSELDYIVDDDTGKAPVDDILFKTAIETKTAREVYNTFMCEDYVYEIFGSAPKMYKQVDRDLDVFYGKFKDQFEFIIVSKENWFTIPPTLFFLSKITSRIKNYSFVETNEEIWNTCDYLITTDPELLKSPRNKKAIKLSRPYNTESKGDYETIQFIDLVENKKFHKLIGYKEKNNKKDKE